MSVTARLLVLVLLSLTACSSSAGSSSPEPGSADVTIELADRPFSLHVPSGYDPATKAPLVVVLHGYTSSGAEQEEYFQLKGESDRRGFLYAMPDGTVNHEKHHFWNATPACCDFFDSGVDDSGYLIKLADAVAAKYAVDPARVYFVGHSNGGFMALRMACEHADRVAAVASWPARPPPTRPSARRRGRSACFRSTARPTARSSTRAARPPARTRPRRARSSCGAAWTAAPTRRTPPRSPSTSTRGSRTRRPR
ncbi:alpha/beta hydrolase family esterase [Phytohabitans flavus]|uniref:alpha/beta hydrolase family esterase n=1 Tax=Phytohabitans flavus TaxID=1076124 RepID=UPI00362D1F34